MEPFYWHKIGSIGKVTSIGTFQGLNFFSRIERGEVKLVAALKSERDLRALLFWMDILWISVR